MIEGLGTLDTSANAEWNELAPLQELDGPLSGGNHKAIGRSVLDSIRANRKSLRGQRDRVFGRLHELGISTEIFERAQAEALQTGSPITQILFADGTLHPHAYYGLLAKELDLPFSATIDPSTILTDMGNASCVLGRPAQVFCRSNDGLTVLFIAPDAVGEQAIRDLIANDPSQRRRICITVPKAVQFALTERREHKLLDEATNGLYRRNPDHSAKIVASPWQGFATGCFLGVMPFALMFAFDIVIALVHLLASAIFSFGLYVRLGALRRLADRKPCDPHSVTGPVPIYSVLVALYKEAPVIAQLVEAMSQLDWPKERLEVLYVCEADDRATIEALEAQHLPYHHRIIEVPPGEPRTKPKALNYALQLCSGEMVVIYDAEDRPHPQQLKQAWASMVDGGEMLACVQAPLVVTNGGSSWISRMFAFEYLTHFAGLLPHLARLGVPLPLGGTSNHFRREALMKAGGWDPFNVTEDADLGIRLSRHGYRCDVLTLPTLEDAPETFQEWKPQRTRWQKGWMQTALVHSRSIPALVQSIGWRNTIHFGALMAGFVLSPLLFPVAIMVVGLGFLRIDETLTLFGTLDLFLLPLGFIAYALLGFACAPNMTFLERQWIIWRLPLYWLMQSLAAWRALYQLVANPHHWEKTPHRPVQNRPVETSEVITTLPATLHPNR